MKNYIIAIEETVTDTFSIQANSLEEAVEKAKEEYKNGNFVLEPGEVHSVKISATDSETNESTDWEKL